MNYLKEFLIDQLMHTEIFEMARDRAEYMRYIDDHTRVVLNHWFLSIYGSQHNLSATNHWKSELSGFIYDWMYTQMKKENPYKIKKSLSTILLDWNDWGKKHLVCKRLEHDPKIKLELPDISQKEIEEISEKISRDAYIIIDLIANRDFEGIDNYIEKL